MKRREFVRLLGGAAAWPLTARAQQPAKLPTIGVLGSGTAAAQAQWTAAFMQRLNELGWTEGRNVAIEYRWGEGRSERFGEIAAQFVRLKVDVILTHNTPPVLAVKQATAVIPIVFATSGDPLASGSLWLIEVSTGKAVTPTFFSLGGYCSAVSTAESSSVASKAAQKKGSQSPPLVPSAAPATNTNSQID